MLCVSHCFCLHLLSLRPPNHTPFHTSSRHIKRQAHHHNMSREFLESLLSRTENYVRSAQGDATCTICLEKYNALNIETGTLEIEIRLPCGHGVGSSCLVTWLKTNNSCPACRATFFSAQSRPYLEHGIMEANIPWHRTRFIERSIKISIRDLCQILQTQACEIVACSMATSVARSWAIMRDMRDLLSRHDQQYVAAASLHMAYARIYPLRNQLIKSRIITQIGLENMSRAIEALPALNWPPLDE